MGFGTLFIGYFLLLNVTYYSFTDLVCALVMALGLTKLSGVNSYFRYASFASLGFAAVGLVEFIAEIVRMLIPSLGVSLWFMPIIRSAVLLALTLLILSGIREVAKEVDLPALSYRAKRMMPAAAVIYLAAVILDTPSLFADVQPITVAAIFAIILLSTLFLIIYNLITIYTAYMKICMPEDLVRGEKKSKFGFVNKFREYENERAKEYAEYRKQKNEKRKKK